MRCLQGRVRSVSPSDGETSHSRCVQGAHTEVALDGLGLQGCDVVEVAEDLGELHRRKEDASESALGSHEASKGKARPRTRSLRQRGVRISSTFSPLPLLSSGLGSRPLRASHSPSRSRPWSSPASSPSDEHSDDM